MQTVLYLEINIIGIALLLIIFFSYRLADIRPTEQKLFDQLLLVMVFVLMTDSIAWCANGNSYAWAAVVNVASNALYYLLSPLLCYFWYVYMRHRVGRPIPERSREAALWAAPMLLNSAMSVASAFTGWYFFFDSSNHYQRGPLFFVYAGISFAFMLLAAGAALCKARRTDPLLRGPYRTLGVLTLLPLCGTLLQTVFPWCYTTLISTVLALLVFYVNTLNQQIRTDSLTQLNNRRRMNEFLAHRLQQLPEEQRLYAIALDVDHFKNINDTYGHAVGDAALKDAASILMAVCADSNSFLARMGGDEFIILDQCPIDGTPDLILDDVQSAFADFSHRNEGSYQLSVSAGFAFADAEHPKRAEQLLSEADAAMYRAKAERALESVG